MWSKINIDSYNSNLTSATRYYYSETQPSDEGDYWYYVDGIPTVWPIQTDFSYISYIINEDGKTCTITGCQETKKSITIPKSIDGYTVTAIGDKAFADCTQLTEIKIPNTVKTIGTRAFYCCTSLTSITIPNSVKSIGQEAFYHCTSLTSISIPYEVTNIDGSAFYGCTSLRKVCHGGTTYWVSNYYIDSYGIATPVTWLKYTINGDGMTCAVAGYKGGYSVVIPETIDGYTVTTIEDRAFYNSRLSKVTIIGNSLTSIGSSAFEKCTSLVSITIPDSVMFIGDFAFFRCESLKRISIPDSVNRIGNYTFEFCSLDEVYYGGTAAQWLCIDIGGYNASLTGATRYYYSETEPTTSGNYWHYVDGKVIVW